MNITCPLEEKKLSGRVDSVSAPLYELTRFWHGFIQDIHYCSENGFPDLSCVHVSLIKGKSRDLSFGSNAPSMKRAQLNSG